MTKRTAQPARLHGFLVVDKPAGWTSHDVVARIRRLIGERHVGHAGTLDPAATGVLPIAVGSATRVVEYLADASKTYLAEVTFGVQTDSHDADGAVIAMADAADLIVDDIESALAGWRGVVDQTPPMHAAIKIGGERLYERARRGEEVDRPPRRVVFHQLELLAWESPVATVLVDCSKGTYVRSLARDIGNEVGAGAYLSNLVRLRSGPFVLCDAWTMDELARRDLEAEWPTIAVHPDAAVQHLDALVLSPALNRTWTTGRPIESHTARSGRARIYDASGTWLGIAEGDPATNVWRPGKVIASGG